MPQDSQSAGSLAQLGKAAVRLNEIDYAAASLTSVVADGEYYTLRWKHPRTDLDGGFDIIAGRSGSGRLANIGTSRLQMLNEDMALLAANYDMVIVDLDEARIAAELEACRADGLQSVAICLVHGYRRFTQG